MEGEVGMSETLCSSYAGTSGPHPSTPVISTVEHMLCLLS